MKLYQRLAQYVDAMHRAQTYGNQEWKQKHKEELLRMVANYLPSGSGFDNGSKLDLDTSEPDCLVINTSFHHMNENGYYTGWTEHKIKVKPSLAYGFVLSIAGRNLNDIKQYIGETFEVSLNQEIDERTGENI